MPVSAQEIEKLERAFEAFNERFEELRSGGLDSYYAEFYTPDALMEAADHFPVAARYRGLEGYRTWFDETYAPYEEVRWADVSFTAVGDRVVADAVITGRPRGEPDRLELRIGLLYTLSGGRIAHVRVFLTPERAMAAARSEAA